MEKWMLIIICNRELEPIRMFDNYEEAQLAMKADFIHCVGAEEFNRVCSENGEPECNDWQLGEGFAWANYFDNVDWNIVPIEVSIDEYNERSLR